RAGRTRGPPGKPPQAGSPRQGRRRGRGWARRRGWRQQGWGRCFAGGCRSVAFGEDAAPGIEQRSRKPVGQTKGAHGLPARLPALQELPPALLLGGVALPVRHGWSLPNHGDPTMPCKTGFAGRSRKYNEALSPGDRAVCDILARAIEEHLPEAENKVWH